MTYEEYCKRSGSPGWIFEVIISDKIKNIEYIHPLKQKLIAEIVKLAESSDEIESIRVFGSAITDECFFDSDLDLCIDWTFDCYDSEGVIVPKAARVLNQISAITKGGTDVVHLKYLEGTVVEEAARNGVIVYERSHKDVC